ncbi:hypothetical protein [Sulfurimonas sp.]|uniref:hypothetical protein n=1 Tax=Sulfurimonas sp. TaxID=2022749 RepID=UPI0019FC8076|nr:hypothetical protein [Sulfurimonas sp.]MBE0513688.1 hypothetical protein [Sulfurimonas sp.]
MKFFLIISILFNLTEAIDLEEYRKYKTTELFKLNKENPTTPFAIDTNIKINYLDNVVAWNFVLKSIEEQTGNWADFGAIAKGLHSDFIYTKISISFMTYDDIEVAKSETIKRKIYFKKRNNISELTSYPSDLIFTSIKINFDLDLEEETYRKYYLNKEKKLKKEKLAKQQQIEKKKFEEMKKQRDRLKIRDKINEYCKIKASEYKTKVIHEHAFNSCKKTSLNENLSLTEVEDKIAYASSDKFKEKQKKLKIAAEKATSVKKKKQKIISENNNAMQNYNKEKNRIDTIIKNSCSDKWRVDYSMVKYCIDKQTKAKNTIDLSYYSYEIKNFCSNKWGTDYSMVKYCMDKQTAAKNAIE